MSHHVGFRLDLHTHSYGSPDGGLSLADYQSFLQTNRLDYVAITDHDRIDTAQEIQCALGDLGARIIIGQEITTDSGEIIGLYLTSKVESGLTPAETVTRIKSQAGLVYIPHPFETIRSGIAIANLDLIARQVDIIEVCNGRAVFQNRSAQAKLWANRNQVAPASSSDTHGRAGWGRTYSVVQQPPTAQNLSGQLQQATFVTRTVGAGVLYPKYNRLRRRLTRGTV